MEAAQGTDNLIKQSQPYLKGVCDGILIKLVKVNQDLRADLPTIGLKTLKIVTFVELGVLSIVQIKQFL